MWSRRVSLIAAVLVTVLFVQALADKQPIDQVTAIASSLRDQAFLFEKTYEHRLSSGGPVKAAIGYNSNLDLIVRAIPLLKSMNLPLPAAGADFATIDNATALAQTFFHWFSQGAAAERTSHRAFHQQLVSAAKKLSTSVKAVGGNAALMAKKLNSVGVEVFLGGPVGPELNTLLNSSRISLAESVPEDQVHLIMEYSKGEEWNGVVAPRANRFIVTYDPYNSEMRGVAAFHHKAQMKSPDFYILSGVHLMEQAMHKEMLMKMLSRSIQDSSIRRPTHFELASMATEDFAITVIDSLLCHATSLGLNEQELALVARAIYAKQKNAPKETGNRRMPMRPFFGMPDREVSRVMMPEKIDGVASTLEALRALFDYVVYDATCATDMMFGTPMYSARAGPFKMPRPEEATTPLVLSRIHFHTLGWHAIVQAGEDTVSGFGGHIQTSVAIGSLTATKQSCGFNPKLSAAVPQDKVEVLLPSNFGDQIDLRIKQRKVGTRVTGEVAKHGVVSWYEPDGYTFAVAPVLLCKAPASTVGLGDAISSMGLLAAYVGEAQDVHPHMKMFKDEL